MCLLIFISIFIFFSLLIISELFLRFLFRRMGNFVWRPFEKYKFLLNEDALSGFTTPVHFRVNKDGERGEDCSCQKKSHCRILVAGGSAAECYFLDQNKSWPEILVGELRNSEEFINKYPDGVHVGNIGKSGMDTGDLKHIFEAVLPRYEKVDYLMLFLGAGDVVNWLMDGAPSEVSNKVKKPEEIFSFVGKQDYKWAIKQTAIYELIRFFRGRFTWQIRENAGKTLCDVRLMRKNARMIIDNVPDSSSMLSRFESDFREAIVTASQYVEKIIVVRQPWFDKDHFTDAEEQLLWHAPKGRPYVENVNTYYSYRVFNEFMRQIDEKVISLCNLLNLACVDLKSNLYNSTETYYDHLHFTEFGSNCVGGIICGFLLTSELGSETNRH